MTRKHSLRGGSPPAITHGADVPQRLLQTPYGIPLHPSNLAAKPYSSPPHAHMWMRCTPSAV